MLTIRRAVEAEVRGRLRHMPAVALLGPRQVGKTTLARAIAGELGPDALYLDLERPADRRKLEDADAYLRAAGRRLCVIDEVQRAPGLFEILRGVIDDRRAAGDRSGHFLLLGSASLDLMRQASESLAGRIAHVEMEPVGVRDAAASGFGSEELWVRGGFPESLVASGGAESLLWRTDFIRSYLERDVPMFAPRMPAETLGRLWTMLAHAQGAPLNAARLASGLGVSAPAVGRYVDLLVDLLLVRRLRPWSGKVGRRLVRAPKTYVRDSGIVHALLGLGELDHLLGHPVAGPSWEGFAIENLVSAAGWSRMPCFYRTQNGAEIDLVLERGGAVEMAIEIKRSPGAPLSRGFQAGCDVLRPRERYLVHGGTDRWPRPNGVTSIGLLDLVEHLAATR